MTITMSTLLWAGVVDCTTQVAATASSVSSTIADTRCPPPLGGDDDDLWLSCARLEKEKEKSIVDTGTWVL